MSRTNDNDNDELRIVSWKVFVVDFRDSFYEKLEMDTRFSKLVVSLKIRGLRRKFSLLSKKIIRRGETLTFYVCMECFQ